MNSYTARAARTIDDLRQFVGIFRSWRAGRIIATGRLDRGPGWATPPSQLSLQRAVVVSFHRLDALSGIPDVSTQSMVRTAPRAVLY